MWKKSGAWFTKTVPTFIAPTDGYSSAPNNSVGAYHAGMMASSSSQPLNASSSSAVAGSPLVQPSWTSNAHHIAGAGRQLPSGFSSHLASPAPTATVVAGAPLDVNGGWPPSGFAPRQRQLPIPPEIQQRHEVEAAHGGNYLPLTG